jgi:hypothetical protein
MMKDYEQKWWKAKSANEQQETPSNKACGLKTQSVIFRTFKHHAQMQFHH